MADQGRSLWGQRITLVVTNAIKVAGLVLAVKAAFSSKQPPALEFALAAFMMAGAQLSEETIMGFVTRMFGGHTEGGSVESIAAAETATATVKPLPPASPPKEKK